MGRRNSFSLVPRSYAPDERCSMGDNHVNDAITNIANIQQRAVATMTHYGVTREQTLPMLFHDTDLEKMRQVKGLVKTDSRIKRYEITQNVAMYIDYEAAAVPAIEPEAMFIQPDRIEPLLAFTAAVKAVHMQYEELKGVVRWLNRNATPGAIRYFFPQAMKLVPTSPIWRDLQEVPTRYSTPVDYGVWAQAIRDAANTVAAIMLLPDDVQARPRNNMWLTFAETHVSLDPTDPNKKHYKTDQIVYNL